MRPEEIGFIHIPRTGGTYLSKKLGLGFFGVWDNGPAGWHKVPENKKSRRLWFTIKRNPYNRVASEAGFLNKQIKDLKDLVVPPDNHLCLQKSLAIHADIILTYENLRDDFTDFFKCLNPAKIPDLSDFSPRTHELSAEEREIIYEKYRDDFEFLGYDK